MGSGWRLWNTIRTRLEALLAFLYIHFSHINQFSIILFSKTYLYKNLSLY